MSTGSDWLDQARRLLDTVVQGQTSAAGAPGSGTGTAHGTDCTRCPFCQAAALLRGERPEVTAALADVLTATATALRTFAEPARSGRPGTPAQPGAPAAPGTSADPASPTAAGSSTGADVSPAADVSAEADVSPAADVSAEADVSPAADVSAEADVSSEVGSPPAVQRIEIA